jgi:hypothetical protein
MSLRLYSKCYCVANIMKRLHLKDYELWMFNELRFL